ncbi:unnamed protein product [Hymenolepis diminuta]|uniref:Uncharacterized protein n=1 Tax=Hymenolepis diminuta TaxID=6216 RepID=A0A564YSW3_HYMDI|nr:unnamed protein product [Hymenolepis diminuta]
MHRRHNRQVAWRRYLRRGDWKEHLISRSQTAQTRRVCSLTLKQPVIPDVVQRHERNDQDINPMYHKDSTAFLSSPGRSCDEDGRELNLQTSVLHMRK